MPKTNQKKKVLIALSGGVDSSVAAALLVNSKKYEVSAAYMINYDNNKPGSESCWIPDYRDALRVAAHLGIPLLKLDFTKEYREKVLDNMFREYEVGRTPNPDILCNTFIKFGFWLAKARELGFDFLATGHYANVKKVKNTFDLMKAKDENKDQTYFLNQLAQKQLEYVLFPVGKYKKEQVRKLAQKFGLPTAQKEESMGICFIGEVPMKEFLEQRIQKKQGNVVLTTGEVVGVHDGLPFYTIGQRHINLSSVNKPLFVVNKNLENNELIVGFEDDPLLYKKRIQVVNPHWINGQAPKFPLKCEVRLRHRQPLQKCTVDRDGVYYYVNFQKKQRAPTSGQFAVFYKNNSCLGGAVIN